MCVTKICVTTGLNFKNQILCTVYAQKRARALIFLVMGLNQAPKWDRAFAMLKSLV